MRKNSSRRTIYLNGRPDFDNPETARAYEIAQAAMEIKHAGAFIFNPCDYLKKHPDSSYVKVLEDMQKELRCGYFSTIVLMRDWWKFPTSRECITQIANGWFKGAGVFSSGDPEIIFVTDELEEDGREYLARVAKAKHDNQRQ